MSYRYNPYRDTFEQIEDEQPINAHLTITHLPYQIVQQVELTQECIEKIAEAVIRRLKSPVEEAEG